MGGALVVAAGIFEAGSVGAMVAGFAINMFASMVLSSLLAPDAPNFASLPNPGNRQQLPPAGDNKLPVVYGSGYVGGVITDVSITADNQCIYYVIALAEVTGSINGGSPDTFTFGDVYWGGRKCVFQDSNVTASTIQKGNQYQITDLGTTTQTQWNKLAGTSGVTYIVGSRFTANSDGKDSYGTGTVKSLNTYQVVSLQDISSNDTAPQTTDVTGNMNIFLYSNGSNNPANSPYTAIQVMQGSQDGNGVGNLTDSNLIYTWDNTKLMSNCAFAIVELLYDSGKTITGLNQTRFQLINLRSLPGDCFLDYLTNNRYGASIPIANIDQPSLTALNNYSSAVVPYTNYAGTIVTQQRYRFDGTLDQTQYIMQNIQSMSDCCNCLIKYNEVTGLWGVIVQQPLYTIAMDLDDSNITGAIQVSPIDISNTYNVIEVKYPDGGNLDSFASATYDLKTIKPSLLYPNEPVNKQTATLYLVNNTIRAQYLANIYLESAREDFQVTLSINYLGLQLESGDIVTLSNTNYGWNKKLFRVMRVTQKFTDSGEITCALNLSEFNPSIYDDKNITQLAPVPNSGLSSPLGFSAINAPTIGTKNASAPIPNFDVNVVTPTSGIVQYAEIWYSAFAIPTNDQLIFYGTTAVSSGGSSYPAGTTLTVNVAGLPSGTYYFFTRMINSVSASAYSLASSSINWLPLTFQYNYRYLAVAYATNSTGTTGFSTTSKTGATYFGIYSSDSTTVPTDSTFYTWYDVAGTSGGRFANLNSAYVIFANRGNRQISLNIDTGTAVAGTKVVPSTTSDFDTKLWQAVV